MSQILRLAMHMHTPRTDRDWAQWEEMIENIKTVADLYSDLPADRCWTKKETKAVMRAAGYDKQSLLKKWGQIRAQCQPGMPGTQPVFIPKEHQGILIEMGDKMRMRLVSENITNPLEFNGSGVYKMVSYGSVARACLMSWGMWEDYMGEYFCEVQVPVCKKRWKYILDTLMRDHKHLFKDK